MIEEKARNLLKNSNLKKTPGRIAILCLLIEEKKPLTQQEIKDKLNKVEINDVTIYRALEAFEKAGIIHKIEGVDKVSRFAISKGPKDASSNSHPHFICTTCGEIECLTELKIPELSPSGAGYKITEREMLIKGLCQNCFEK